jgi:hypothetical protein
MLACALCRAQSSFPQGDALRRRGRELATLREERSRAGRPLFIRFIRSDEVNVRKVASSAVVRAAMRCSSSHSSLIRSGLVSATFCVGQRPQLRSIGLAIYEITEFAAELFGITVHHARPWTSGAGEMARNWHGLVR